MAGEQPGDGYELLKVPVLQFMADYGHLDQIHTQCCLHLSSSSSCSTLAAASQTTVYKFVLLIDTLKLLQANALVGDLLLHQPSKGWSLFHAVIFAVIQEMQWLPSLSSEMQLLLLLRLTAVPDFSPYHLSHVSELPQLNEWEGRFVSCTGIVSSMSGLEKYTESACFHCSDINCVSSHYIRCHTTGSSEYITMRGDLSCLCCGNGLVEDVTQRTLADKVVISLVPSQAIKTSHVRFQSFTIVLRDDLCGLVEIGSEYTVIGVPVHSTQFISGRIIVNTLIEANNVCPLVKRPIPQQLSTHIKDIYDACQYSSWTFPATLAYSFGADIAPPGIHHRLKLVLLLSLVATGSIRERMIDVLLIGGTDTESVRQLLLYAGSFSERCVTHGVGLSLNGVTRKDDGVQWFDAGSLLLAKKGICLLRNINQWRKDEREQLNHILETGHVTTKSTKRTVGNVAVMTASLSCSLWMSYDSHVTSLCDDSSTKPLHEKIGVSKGLMDHCGLVLVTDPPTQENENFVDGIVSTHILQKAMGGAAVPLLTSLDFHEIISVCSNLSVTLQQSAHQLLKGFYLTSRRLRGSDTPLTALDLLISLTAAHAKLSLRSKATEDDALLAILLYEESLIQRYGYCTLYIGLAPHVREQDTVSSFIGKDLDQNMRLVSDQIKRFIRNHTQDMYPFSPLEREE